MGRFGVLSTPTSSARAIVLACWVLVLVPSVERASSHAPRDSRATSPAPSHWNDGGHGEPYTAVLRQEDVAPRVVAARFCTPALSPSPCDWLRFRRLPACERGDAAGDSAPAPGAPLHVLLCTWLT